jgi:outer membrane protein OmpA-like peptidoglycan-associated protein
MNIKRNLVGVLTLLIAVPLLSSCAWREGAPCNDTLLKKGPSSTAQTTSGGTAASDADLQALKDKVADLERRLANNEGVADSALSMADRALKCCRKDYTIFATENIYFDFNRTEIRPGDALILDKVAEKMKLDPESIAQLSGYADAVGKSDYNTALGQHRGESARDYLESKGINGTRFSIQTFGNSKAIKPASASNADRESDRRVTIDILSYGQK